MHNGQSFLDEALASVLNQDYPNWELIAVENGSNDASFKILLNWAAKDSRIKAYTNSEKGKNQAYNRAFSECSGDFICFFAADDILHKSSLGKRVAPLSVDHIAFNFTTCLLETFSNERSFNGVVFPKNKMKPNYSGGSIFFTREIAQEIFPIPPDLPNEDTWSSFYLKYFGTGTHISESLYYYRIHPNNSYGYHIDFHAKRIGFLNRMMAVDPFLKRYYLKLSGEKRRYLIEYKKGLDAAFKNDYLRILTAKVAIKDKFLLCYYCSPFLFKVKNRFFRFFSGRF